MGKDKGIDITNGMGVALDHCRICAADIGIVLYGKQKGHEDEDCKNVCTGHLCEKCQKVLDMKGCVIIEVKDGETGNNPYRTGRIVGVNEEIKNSLGITDDSVFMHKSNFSKLFKDLDI